MKFLTVIIDVRWVRSDKRPAGTDSPRGPTFIDEMIPQKTSLAFTCRQRDSDVTAIQNFIVASRI